MSQNAYPTGGAQGPGQNTVQAVVVGSLDSNGNFVPASASAGLPTTGGGGGGGGAVTVADGADVNEGSTADAVIAAGAAGTVSAKLRRISTDIGTLATNSAAKGQATMAASVPVAIASDQSAVPVSLGTVKAASTPAVAADTALVVAISPNNAVGILDSAGTNKATVKPASTAAVATDTSLVVQPLIAGLVQSSIALSGSTVNGSALTVGGLSASITELNAVSFAAASGNSAIVTPTTGTSAIFALNLTAFTAGSSTGLDCVLQYSPDAQTNWYDFWHFERLTAASEVTTPPLPYSTMPRRVKFTNAGGAATTATASLVSTRVTTSVPPVYQFFDRTAGLLSGTASATGTAFRIDGAKNVTVGVTLGTATTPASYQIQVSADGTNWVGVAAGSAAVASSTTRYTATGVTERFVRVAVTSAATAQTGTVIYIAATV